MWDEVELEHFRVGDSGSLVVVFGDELGGDDEAGFRRRSADEIEGFVDVGERLAGPVSADLAEEAVFDGIPLGRTGRVMADGHLETQRSADGVLKGFFPGTAAGTVAATAISQDKQFAGGGVSLAALLKPPLSDRIDGKGWGVVAGSQKDGAPVGLRVVNA